MSKERLVELLEEAAEAWDEYIEECFKSGNNDEKTYDEFHADYLLKNGVIVPPCKVGDKLYAISDTRVVECTCYELSTHNELQICAEFNCDYDCKGCPFSSWVQEHSGEYSCHGEYGDWFFSESDFGKKVFLTREEAEAKLKEGAE